MPLQKGAIAIFRLAAPIFSIAVNLLSCSRESAFDAQSRPAARGFEAKGVALEIALSNGGGLVVKGDLLSLDEASGAMSVSGRASVAARGGGSAISARADRIVVKPDGPTLDLEGEVRARFLSPGRGGADAAP